MYAIRSYYDHLREPQLRRAERARRDRIERVVRVAQAVERHMGARKVLRRRPPNLGRLGLGRLTDIVGVPPVAAADAHFGRMAEASPGKDTTTGHWEMAGVT